MNAADHFQQAKKWARSAQGFREEEYTPADSYSRANYHLLLALLKSLNADFGEGA